ncbi:DNA-directed RNA polymerase III subunit RPC7 isoform X2 [Hyla sarda]|uniref:DNA-directed RNA polymerase III subunit RPC7 isoform X2 n=1 Tax=Hyla sarda TaxID=327740 RepID=UPI0024C2F6C4|nr:DNA-directed RNA polymerase III subunit RPC7 isoform X2 [Hyla sarda]
MKRRLGAIPPGGPYSNEVTLTLGTTTQDMAGKGRGRGANFTFDLQAIGFSRGEALPETQAQPTPLYPNSEYKPASLLEGEEQTYLLALKQELRGNMKKLPYYIGKEIQQSNWQLLPREMKAVKKKRKAAGEKKAKAAKPDSKVDVLKKIEELEKKGDDEKSDEENEEKKKGEDEEEEEAEVEVDEEEIEEENDYIASYFEDGDEYGNSDDNMDEATY